MKSLYGRAISIRKAATTDPRYWAKLNDIIQVMQMKYRAIGYNPPEVNFIPEEFLAKKTLD